MNRNGRISVDGKVATIFFERRLNHPIKAVWAALTDPEERKAWFGRTTFEPKVGGDFDMLSEGPPSPEDWRRVKGKVLVWDPPHVFEHEWNQSIVGQTIVRYELTEDGDGTLLRFTHSRFTPQHAKGFIPGEHAFLDRMEAHLDRKPLPQWQARYDEVKASYA